MSKGWISIHREIQEHWIWKEKREFSNLEAWLDILLNVNHTEKKVLIKGALFTVKRGQSINSQLTWGNRWNWNRSKVRRFLELLQKDEMIALNTNNKTTILTVCKYDSYQDTRTSNEHRMNIKRTSDEHQMNTNNKDNNINKENNENNDVEEENTLHPINILKNHYLSKEKVLDAIINNPINKVKDLEDLKVKLNLFCSDLIEQGRESEKWLEFTRYFINSLRRGKFEKSIKPSGKIINQKDKKIIF